ncbi:hypothetical protein [Nonlabens sp. Asnod3-A02]|uniref:hypothetical protein n=1 Tax=Nonlabens sp. Asnod3-A02 TaxID=3160579 RepID=UPI003867C90E
MLTSKLWKRSDARSKNLYSHHFKNYQNDVIKSRCGNVNSAFAKAEHTKIYMLYCN